MPRFFSFLVLVFVTLGSVRADEGAQTAPERLLGAAYDTREDRLRVGTDRSWLSEWQQMRVICVGESHTHPVHHRIQLSVIRTFSEMDERPLAIGLEMLWRAHQPHLDAWMAGDIDLDTLLERVNWKKTWGYDFDLYRPIFEYAKAHDIPVLGLNAPRGLIRSVGRHGIRGLAPAELMQVPEMDLSNEAHRRRFFRNIRGGHGHKMPEERLEKMYQAMTLWDEYMAESASRYIRGTADRKGRFIVLAGSGHIEGRTGIPDRITRRTGFENLVIHPRSMDLAGAGKKPTPESADIVWYTRPDPLPERIETDLGFDLVGGSKGGGVWIAGPTRAHLKASDLLWKVNGKGPIRTLDEAKKALEGTTRSLTVYRAGERKQVRLQRRKEF